MDDEVQVILWKRLLHLFLHCLPLFLAGRCFPLRPLDLLSQHACLLSSLEIGEYRT